jgi:hypothetical protein
MRVAGKQLPSRLSALGYRLSALIVTVSGRGEGPQNISFWTKGLQNGGLISNPFHFYQAGIEGWTTSHIGKTFRGKGVDADAIGHEL